MSVTIPESPVTLDRNTHAGTTAKGWLYADHLGSIVAVVNSAGASTATYRYGPYGEPDTFASAMRFRYTGQQLLGELGLYHYKAQGAQAPDQQ